MTPRHGEIQKQNMEKLNMKHVVNEIASFSEGLVSIIQDVGSGASVVDENTSEKIIHALLFVRNIITC